MATFIHGIAASENIDSSGECVSIAGLDISSLEKDGVFTYEHEQGKVPDKDGKQVELQVKIPSQVVGKILKAHKIFSEKDCEDKHQLYFWNKVKTPYLYVMGELFDDYTEAAKDVAGKFRYDADKKGQNTRTVMNFSVEGNVLPNSKEGMMVVRSIARKVTLTGFPCNKAAVAEMIPVASKIDDDISSIFKTEPSSEIEIFKFESNYVEFLNKKEELSKAQVPGSKYPPASAVSPTSVKDKAGPPKWGPIPPKNPNAKPMSKAMNAGSALAAPSQLVQGAALAKEDKLNQPVFSNTKGKDMRRQLPGVKRGAGTSHMGSHIRQALSNPEKAQHHIDRAKQIAQKTLKNKSKWLARAEQEYDAWGKKEQFEKFMQKRLPHLNKAEIKAIGQTLALHKSMKLEKALSRINPAYEEETTQHSSVRKTTDIMMASEKNKK